MAHKCSRKRKCSHKKSSINSLKNAWNSPSPFRPKGRKGSRKGSRKGRRGSRRFGSRRFGSRRFGNSLAQMMGNYAPGTMSIFEQRLGTPSNQYNAHMDGISPQALSNFYTNV